MYRDHTAFSGLKKIIVDNWSTDESLCDISPKPWGDGVIDIQGLIVLTELLFEEIPSSDPAE